MKPPEAETVSPAAVGALLALLAVRRRDGRATVVTVAGELGLEASRAHELLAELRRAGLVEMGVPGGLIPTVLPDFRHVSKAKRRRR